MSKPHSLVTKPVAAALLLAAAGLAQADVTVYTSLAAFHAATSASGVDSFDDVVSGEGVETPGTRSAGVHSYSFSVSDEISYAFGAGSAADAWLSTNAATDVLSFSGFSPGVVALGGYFFATGFDGAFAPGSVVLTATDADGSVTRTLVATGIDSFLGFVSSGPLLSVTLATAQPFPDGLFPTVNNLVLASAVPEPGSWALMLAGLGVGGLMARRRRS